MKGKATIIRNGLVLALLIGSLTTFPQLVAKHQALSQTPGAAPSTPSPPANIDQLKEEEGKALSVLSSVGATNPSYGDIAATGSDEIFWSSPAPADTTKAYSGNIIIIDINKPPPFTLEGPYFEVGIPNSHSVMTSSALPYADHDNYWAFASANMHFQCGNLDVYIQTERQSDTFPTPPNATDQDISGLAAQMNSTAHSLEDAARADAGDRAKAIAQGLVSNGLCNAGMAEENCGPPLVNAVATKDLGAPSSSSSSYANLPWTFTYQVVKNQGLVINGIKAGDQPIFQSISIPHFKIGYGGGKEKIIRFDGKNCETQSKSISIYKDDVKGIDTLHWSFAKQFKEPDLNGWLNITYNYLVRYKLVNNCEYGGSDCYRFIPTVSYLWIGNTPAHIDFTSFYKIDYGQIGLAVTSDTNNLVGNALANTGRQEIQKYEATYNAVKNGREGDIDNIHTAHPGESIWLPGCRFNVLGHLDNFKAPFDCVHMHWRWAGTGAIGGAIPTMAPNIDPMVVPSTDDPIDPGLRGEPYLVPDQTINITIVKYHQGEEDPDDPAALVNQHKQQGIDNQIATLAKENVPVGKGPPQPRENQFVPQTVEHVIVWYAASVHDDIFAIFFRHGIFVLDPKQDYRAVNPPLDPSIPHAPSVTQ